MSCYYLRRAWSRRLLKTTFYCKGGKIDKGMKQTIMQSTTKTNHHAEQASLPKQTFVAILSQTIKTGIIKSNLIPMFAGLTLALYTYDMSLFDNIPEIILAFIGSFLVIGAAGAFNNLYDRDIDAIMERTKSRPTVTGEVKPTFVLVLASSMAILGIGALALTTPLAALLGFLGLFFMWFRIQCGQSAAQFIIQKSEVFQGQCLR